MAAEPIDDAQLFALIGDEGFARLTRAFYAKVPGDPILGPMYPDDDLEGAEERLREFLVFRFGGPPRYIEQRGHPRLRMRHLPFTIDRAARDRWMKLMLDAMAEAAFEEPVETTLKTFFETASEFMINKT